MFHNIERGSSLPRFSFLTVIKELISLNIYSGIESLVGNTKLFYLGNYCKSRGVKAKLCVKLESGNPAGSVKDRAALYMIKDAERRGILKKGSVIIEPTSGNTGIGLAAIGRARGYRVILTMPDTMSIERRNLLSAYGAEIILTEGRLGMKGAIDKADELSRTFPDSFIPGQFDNPANTMAHTETTGPEIWRDTDGTIAAFVAGIGTGATLSGTAKYLKSRNPGIHTVGVEPLESPMITEGIAGPHKIQGIGANFVPGNYDTGYCDEIIKISGEEAYSCGREVARTEGILIGITSGAAVCAAEKLAEKGIYNEKIIVAVAADSGEHYLSVKDYLL